MRWVPRFIFGPEGDQETLDLTLPVALWQHGGPSMGTARATATGIPAVSIINRKRTLVVPVRFYEAEWPGVRRLVEWGQTKAPFIWIPEPDYPEKTVYLDAPGVNDLVVPTTDANYPRVSSLALTFRQIA